jgi:hypothetical protein
MKEESKTWNMYQAHEKVRSKELFVMFDTIHGRNILSVDSRLTRLWAHNTAVGIDATEVEIGMDDEREMLALQLETIDHLNLSRLLGDLVSIFLHWS